MGLLKKSVQWAEALNTFYQAIGILYVIALAVAALNRSTLLIIIAVVAPVIAGLAGYVLRPIVEERTQRYGFRILSDQMTYEIKGNHKYTLSYSTTLEAKNDHLMVYPIGYRWSGRGTIGTPKLTNPGQQLMAPVSRTAKKQRNTPYEALEISAAGDWHYWFVAFNPALHKGATPTIDYTQDFQDTKVHAHPHLSYFVRKPMKKLVLQVKFPSNQLPTEVDGNFIKTNDPNRPYKKSGVVYDKHKQWATWTIHHPKRGYYRLDWR